MSKPEISTSPPFPPSDENTLTGSPVQFLGNNSNSNSNNDTNLGNRLTNEYPRLKELEAKIVIGKATYRDFIEYANLICKYNNINYIPTDDKTYEKRVGDAEILMNRVITSAVQACRQKIKEILMNKRLNINDKVNHTDTILRAMYRFAVGKNVTQQIFIFKSMGALLRQRIRVTGSFPGDTDKASRIDNAIRTLPSTGRRTGGTRRRRVCRRRTQKRKN